MVSRNVIINETTRGVEACDVDISESILFSEDQSDDFTPSEEVSSRDNLLDDEFVHLSGNHAKNTRNERITDSSASSSSDNESPSTAHSNVGSGDSDSESEEFFSPITTKQSSKQPEQSTCTTLRRSNRLQGVPTPTRDWKMYGTAHSKIAVSKGELNKKSQALSSKTTQKNDCTKSKVQDVNTTPSVQEARI